MELLGGYGSGSDSEPDSPQAAAGNTGTATLLRSSPPRPAVPPAAPAEAIDPSQLLSKLPAPSGSKAPLFSGLPRAQQKKKVVVQFRVPISYDPADVKKVADDEEPARKRQKASSRGMSLSELLPAPKNTQAAAGGGGGGGRRLDVLGGSGSRKGGKYDSDDDEIVPGTEDRSGMVDLRPGDVAADGNEAYRVDASATAAPYPSSIPGGGGAPVAAAQQYDAAAQAQYEQWQQYYAQHQGHEYAPHQQAAAAAAAAGAADPAEAMLQAALAAERERAARQGRGGAVEGIQIKEVRADTIRQMDPGQRAEANALRNAFGADYEAKLRAEAGSDPSKMAKRRHQIGSLYHYAKQKELEQLEVRAQGAKTKAETHRKYGW